MLSIQRQQPSHDLTYFYSHYGYLVFSDCFWSKLHAYRCKWYAVVFSTASSCSLYGSAMLMESLSAIIHTYGYMDSSSTQQPSTLQAPTVSTTEFFCSNAHVKLKKEAVHSIFSYCKLLESLRNSVFMECFCTKRHTCTEASSTRHTSSLQAPTVSTTQWCS